MSITVLKYPAHAEDFYVVCSPKALQIMQDICRAYGHLNGNHFNFPDPIEGTQLVRELQQEHTRLEQELTKHLCLPRHKIPLLAPWGPMADTLEYPIGVTLAPRELYLEEIYMITKALKALEVHVTAVPYGSNQHRIWLSFYGD